MREAPVLLMMLEECVFKQPEGGLHHRTLLEEGPWTVVYTCNPNPQESEAGGSPEYGEQRRESQVSQGYTARSSLWPFPKSGMPWWLECVPWTQEDQSLGPQN